MVNLSPKQRRIAKAKLAGLQNKEIGRQEYPAAKPQSQEVLVSRQLNKPHVAQYLQTEIEQSLARHEVTKEQYFMNIGLAMKADKQNQFTGEITPDIGARLAGNRMAERYLFKEDELPAPSSIEGFISSEDVDEVELQRAVFRKNKQEPEPGN